MTDWKEVHDSRAEQPAVLDTSSSSTTVYERRNIRQETREVTMGEETQEMTEWVYEQRELSAAEYAEMTSPATKAIMQAISDVELKVAMAGIE